MSDRGSIIRRSFLKAAAGAAGGLVFAPARPSWGQLDQGIGGTGAAPPGRDPDHDQGIGGTGVIGTIRRFGSIIVNDLRIGYAADVVVTVDGAPATASALKLGQVVRVVADGRDGHLSTRQIAVTSEVVGKIDAVSARTISVLGQMVSVAELPGPVHWRRGDHVGVSGLRRPDGVIVASLIEPRPDTINRVSGPVDRGPDGIARIAGLRLTGLDASRIGRRAVVGGNPAADGFAVSDAHAEQELFERKVERLSIEGYVERRGTELRLGSGFVVAASGPAPRRGGGPTRAIVTTTVDRDGRLRLDRVQVGPPAEKPGRDVPKPRGDRTPVERPVRPQNREDIRDLGQNGIRAGRPFEGTGPRGPGGGAGRDRLDPLGRYGAPGGGPGGPGGGDLGGPFDGNGPFGAGRGHGGGGGGR